MLPRNFWHPWNPALKLPPHTRPTPSAPRYPASLTDIIWSKIASTHSMAIRPPCDCHKLCKICRRCTVLLYNHLTTIISVDAHVAPPRAYRLTPALCTQPIVPISVQRARVLSSYPELRMRSALPGKLFTICCSTTSNPSSMEKDASIVFKILPDPAD